MNSFSLVLLVATAFAAVSAEIDIGGIIDGIDGIVDVHNGNANDYADQMLKKIRLEVVNRGLDPLMLPLKSFEFSKKVLLVEVRGSAKVYDGYLKGLSTLHRTGLASMNTNAETGAVTFRATIGVNDLIGSYKASAKFMNFGPSFGININMESVGVTFEIVQSVEKGSKPQLLSFGIVDLGKIKTEIDGDLNILDFILNKFSNFVINLVKDVVAGALDIPLRKLLQDLIDNNELPDLIQQI